MRMSDQDKQELNQLKNVVVGASVTCLAGFILRFLTRVAKKAQLPEVPAAENGQSKAP